MSKHSPEARAVTFAMKNGLRAEMYRQKVTPSALARKMGVPLSDVRRMFDHTTGLKLFDAASIAYALGLRLIPQLAYRKESKP